MMWRAFKGSAITSPFLDLGLSDGLANAVDALGYEKPTPIQEAAIPSVLMGRDILGSAQTGTGKTASFTLPMIDILDAGRAKARMPRSLILAPTRELAAQVAESFEKFSVNHRLSMALLIGGVSFSDQEAALDKGVDVLIATPGRLLDHFERGKVLLQDVKILVIDEADRMLDMGFIPDVERIVGYLPVMRQTLFFSATLSEEIHKIGKKFVMNPKIIEVAKPASTADTVSQRLIWTKPRDKREVLRKLLRRETLQNAVIFCNRKRDISTLLSSLKRHEFNAAALHGDMTQSARLAALSDFKEGRVTLLIASDVAARGLDIPSVSHVFNFDVPSNAEDYVHRIGRTGRAGRTGSAFTLAASEDDKKYLHAIETLIGKSIELDEAEKSGSTAPVNVKADVKANSQSDNDSAGKSRSRNKKSGKKQAVNENDRTGNEKAAAARDARYSDEKRPPEWKGNSFRDSDHIPAFLR
ncbi:MAG: DEAD/DEAH box helicase [Candidatus Puniceispirillaceae bacterium]